MGFVKQLYFAQQGFDGNSIAVVERLLLFRREIFDLVGESLLESRGWNCNRWCTIYMLWVLFILKSGRVKDEHTYSVMDRAAEQVWG